jgi:Coenzyme PQQ synthesis protein D (PqqD)
MTNSTGSSGAAVPARRPDVEWVELDEDAVLYDPSAHTVHRLNSTAATVWKACDGNASEIEIARAIERVYPGSDDAIARDIAAVIARFRRLNLLRQSPAEGGRAR